MPSFDIKSEIDKHELTNVVDQANRVLKNRFDFKDAGAEYLWLDNEKKSSLVKSKEIIIDEAFEADYWLNQNSYNSISAVTDFDENFKNFLAVKKQQLYNNNSRLNDKGGNDYWESGVINPHLVLKDLIEIFHPELLDHKLYYYRKME